MDNASRRSGRTVVVAVAAAAAAVVLVAAAVSVVLEVETECRRRYQIRNPRIKFTKLGPGSELQVAYLTINICLELYSLHSWATEVQTRQLLQLYPQDFDAVPGQHLHPGFARALAKDVLGSWQLGE